MTTKIPTTLLDTTQPYPAGDTTQLMPFLHVREEQPSGTAGGSSTASTWQQRVLNTVKTNGIPGASLAANQITLPAGTYYAEASAPCYAAAACKARLRNATNSATAVVGESVQFPAAASVGGRMRVSGRFTLTASSALQLEQFVNSATATTGLGVPTNSGEVEVYAEVKIWKIA
jgi:hypothetical protein